MRFTVLLTCLLLASGAPVAFAGDKNASPKAASWYMKTVAVVQDGEEVFFDDRSGVFGRIPGADVGPDRHDVRAFSSVAGSPAAIVFAKSAADWGADAGEYLSDYRPPGNDKQVWTFTVTSSRTNADVTLYWESFFVISPASNGGWNTVEDNDNHTVAKLSLLDLATGERIPASNKKGLMKSHTFNMNGATKRYFRWVQGRVSKEDMSLAGVSSLDIAPAAATARAISNSRSISGAASKLGTPPEIDQR